jgi:hypothetical protein
VYLTNDTVDDVYFLSSCYDPPSPLEFERLPGVWDVVVPNWFCICYCPAWNLVPAGSTASWQAFTDGPGTYRSSFLVGWRCTNTATGDPNVDCASWRRVTTDPYEVN